MTLGAVLRNAALSLFAGSSQVMSGESSAEVYAALKAVPAWALGDYAVALRQLASPMFAGCVLSAAGLFALLLDWRRRGASASN